MVRRMIGAGGVVAFCFGVATAAENMIGRQSQNEGLCALPAKGAIRIDGQLGEWDLSGQIWSFADLSVRDRFSVKSAAMWDRDAIYLCFVWKDPTPLSGTVNPDFNPSLGWRADAIQFRILADGQTSWLTTWHVSGDKRSVLHRAYWKDESGDKKGLDEALYVSKPGETTLGEGIELAYSKLEDQSGFVQEMRIPWSVIYKKPHAAVSDETFRMGLEFIWSGPTGEDWPSHRYADNLQPGKTSREFFWTAKDAWGNVTLLKKGGIEPRRYSSGESKPSGTVPVRLALPQDASGFTLVIEDEAGRRIRNLVGGGIPSEYAQKGASDGKVEVLWDALDDDGKAVAPGRYRVRGLVHGPIGAEYEQCFYNPGTPPWGTTDGSGAWGGDHAVPEYLAAAGEQMAIGWGFAEGGHGLILINKNGRKVWGEKRGVQGLAADAEFIYCIPRTWNTTTLSLMRLRTKKGIYAPFVLDGKERPLELSFEEIFGKELPGKFASMTRSGSELVILFDSGVLAFLDAASASVKHKVSTTLTGEKRKDGLAVTQDGKTVYVIDGNRVHAVNGKDGTSAPMRLDGVERPSALGLDRDNNLLVMDDGVDQQVKAFTVTGAPVYACGRKGGRPLRGAFDEQALSHVSFVEGDANGTVWAAEAWDYPRRVSLWGRDGKLVRDYIGNTSYSATGSFLHESDPSRGYLGPIEMALDRTNGTWKVTRILWVPDTGKGECFEIDTHSHNPMQVFYSTASGTKHEYMFVAPYRDWHGYLLLMNGKSGWRPVCYVGSAGVISGSLGPRGEVKEQPSGVLAGSNAYDGVFWNDLNGDGRVQREECECLSAAKPGDGVKRGTLPIPTTGAWSTRMSAEDLGFYVSGLAAYRPERYLPDGAPVFSSRSLKRYDEVSNGDFVPSRDGQTLLSLDGGSKLVRGLDLRTGKEKWRYPNPYPQVHGSHRATMPKDGLLIGPLKIMGEVQMGTGIGGVFAMRGNLGQDFFMTTDGLFVASLFQDCRLPVMSLPPSEAQLKGMPLEIFSQGGEPFNGWIGRHDDGVVRMSCGMPGQAALVARIKGLETIQRVTGPELVLTEEQLAAALRANAERVAQSAKASVYAIGSWVESSGWNAIAPLAVEREGQPVKAVVKLAWDALYLKARFEVNDPTPWLNEGKDATRLFKTGDAVDLQVSDSGNDRPAAGEGDQRIVMASLNGKPVAVLMREVDRAGRKEEKVVYHSPVMDKTFARVKVLTAVQVTVEKAEGRYVVEAKIPWKELGIAPVKGKLLRGDVGFILSDASGTINTARVYWSNKNTNLVNDLPSEAKLAPETWGVFSLE